MKLSSFGGAFAVLSHLGDISTRPIILLPLVAATCYFPNGTDTNIGLSGEKIYHPCKGGDKRNSMCCRTRDHDWCRSDGLCLNSQDNEIWRESCTDPTWRSPECVKLCVFGMDERGSGDERVTVCGDGSYCCGMGVGASQCCSLGRGMWIVNGTAVSRDPLKVVPQTVSLFSTTTTTRQRTQSTRLPPPESWTTSQSTSQSTTTSPSTPNSSSPPTSTPPPPPPPPPLAAAQKSYKRLATLIGSILGGLIALLLLLAILIYLLRRRLHHHHQRKTPQQQQQQKKQEVVEGSLRVFDPPPHRPQAPAPERQRQRQLLEEGVLGGGQVPEIDGRVRPPEEEEEEEEEEELDGRAVYEVGEGMAWVDRRRNAVMRMGF